jgi:hypothetical protein
MEGTDGDEGSGSSHKGGRISSYTIRFKLKVVGFAKATNNAQAAKLFKVNRKPVIEWRKEEEFKCMHNQNIRKIGGGAGPRLQFPDIEKKILDYIERGEEKQGPELQERASRGKKTA